MRTAFLTAAIASTLLNSHQVFANSETEELQLQVNKLKQNYERDIQALESRLLETEKKSKQSSNNDFNPAISLVLDGIYSNYENDPEEYELPGFSMGGEAGLGERGLSIGHSELIFSANIDDKFYGQLTAALAEHEGETELELEEAFIQTLALGNGITIKAGRFFSEIGYLNGQHSHVWDFADAPLIYRGLFGNQLIDDGLQFTYIAPTDTFLQVGAELFSGSRFPAGGRSNDIGAWTIFADIGGDIGVEHSWKLGLSHWQADDIEGREAGGHGHGEEEATETPSFTGESKINAIDLVYKWAPNGNPRNQSFKLQFEYFDRTENGNITMLNSDPLETTTYDGEQNGGYIQATYKFKPQWQAGIRFDQLDSDNKGSDADILEEAGLDNEGHTPERTSVMLEWLPSEFSRVRIQYNNDESFEETDKQIFLQYTMSLGSHGAHQF